MADKFRKVDYYSVEVPDKPGEGARVLAALQEQGVSLLSMTAFPAGSGKSQIALIGSSGDVEAAGKKAGLKLSGKKQAFFVSGADRPGAVANVLRKLADAKVNVTATNAAAGETGFGMVIWVKPTDVDKAAKALGI